MEKERKDTKISLKDVKSLKKSPLYRCYRRMRRLVRRRRKTVMAVSVCALAACCSEAGAVRIGPAGLPGRTIQIGSNR